MTNEERIWLAYLIGRLPMEHAVSGGRDALRAMKSIWDWIGIPQNEWPQFEKAVMRNDPPIAMRVDETQRRAITHLSGCNCPMGPHDRWTGG